MKNTLKLRGTLEFAFIILILAISYLKVHAQIVDVWAVGDGEKIFRYDTDHAARAGNSIWDGRQINLRGLYNEVLGFQVIAEIDSTGAMGLEVSMTPACSSEIRYGYRGQWGHQVRRPGLY